MRSSLAITAWLLSWGFPGLFIWMSFSPTPALIGATVTVATVYVALEVYLIRPHLRRRLG